MSSIIYTGFSNYENSRNVINSTFQDNFNLTTMPFDIFDEYCELNQAELVTELTTVLGEEKDVYSDDYTANINKPSFTGFGEQCR